MADEVGYGKPPRRSQFRKGRSGNPKGRPRKAKPAAEPASAFDVIVDRTLTVTRSGVEAEVSAEEALQHQTLQAALTGDRAAQREVLKMIARREAALAKTRPPGRRKVEFLDPEHDPRTADDALLILGIACEDPHDYGPNNTERRLLLEPWAVQAALSRRRGGSKLEQRDRAEIRRVTKDADRLRWPRGTAS